MSSANFASPGLMKLKDITISDLPKGRRFMLKDGMGWALQGWEGGKVITNDHRRAYVELRKVTPNNYSVGMSFCTFQVKTRKAWIYPDEVDCVL